MAIRKFTNIFVLLLILMVGSRYTLFLVYFTLKNVRTDPKCQPSEDELPIIKPIKKKFFINRIRGDLFGYQSAT